MTAKRTKMSVKTPRKPARQSAAKRARKLTRKPAKSARRPLLRASLAVSLDGFIAEADGGVAWLNPYFSPEMDFVAFMRSIGAVVMGRKTFTISQQLGGAPIGTGRWVVLTRRRKQLIPGVETFAGDLRVLVERLGRELAGTGQDIWLMGGGQAIDGFRAAGLVDRYELAIIPVLLGQGIPLFPRHSRGLEGLQQTHFRALKNGVTEAWYEPQPK